MSHRVYGLDIVRATAILTVVYMHAILNLGIPALLRYSIGDGVSIFFVLSGFLIGKILLNTINKPAFSLHDLTKFWFRRWMRTLPAYFFVLSLLIIYQVLTSSNHFSNYYHYYFFTQSLFYNGAALYPESWSLCVEEWFYLIVPVVFLISAKHSKKALLFCILSIIVVCSAVAVIRAAPLSGHDEWDVYVRQATTTRFDSIMYGVLGAYCSYHGLWKNRKVLFIIGLGCYLAITLYYDVFGFTLFLKYFWLPIQSISVLLTLPFLENIRTGSGIIYRTVTFVSVISYSMYLLCFTPFQIIHSKLSSFFHVNSIGFTAIVYLAITFGGAYLLNKLIEKPCMNLRDRHARKKQQHTAKKRVPT